MPAWLRLGRSQLSPMSWPPRVPSLTSMPSAEMLGPRVFLMMQLRSLRSGRPPSRMMPFLGLLHREAGELPVAGLEVETVAARGGEDGGA